jgi:ATP-binding cassette subfamily F protein 3
VGVYAQHVYTTLPENDTVLEYLEHQAAPKTYTQQIKDVAGSLLFSGELIEKKIRVLSGGERARLVLAGLLLKQHNVLVLDEPGNHLDVESVEALADALTRYRGTVIFTSHDRHFMHRVATHVIEVRTGRVASYPASYDDYVYRVQNEIDKGHREAHTVASPGKPNSPPSGAPATGGKSSGRADRDSQKKLKAVERKIAKLDDEKRSTADALLSVTETAEAKQLQTKLATLTAELATLEEQWLALSEDLDGV